MSSDQQFGISEQFADAVILAVLALVFWLVSASADAQICRVQTLLPPRCNIGQCVPSTGTATAVAVHNDGRKTYFLTAGHVVEGISRIDISIDHGLHRAEVIAASSEFDVAVIAIDQQQAGYIFPLCESEVRSGTEVEFVGFPAGKQFLRRSGHVYNYDGPWLFVTTEVHQGDSGGPMLVDGQVVGILKGYLTSQRNMTISASAATIKAWLTSQGIAWNDTPARTIQEPHPTPSRPRSQQSDPPVVAAPDRQFSPADPALKQEVESLRERADRLEREFRERCQTPVVHGSPGQIGQQGPRGPKGDPGEPGPAGPPGQGPAANEVAAAIVKEYPHLFKPSDSYHPMITRLAAIESRVDSLAREVASIQPASAEAVAQVIIQNHPELVQSPGDYEALRQQLLQVQSKLGDMEAKAFIDVRWTDKNGQPVTETRRYRLGQRIDLNRDTVTVQGDEE